MESKSRKVQSFERLVSIVEELREKCPWDRKQTIQSLRHLTIEEVYELGEAILEKDYDKIKEELGDLLLHIVFYSNIASEIGRFDISEVCHSICEKLIERHPHVYGDTTVKDDKEVKRNWERIKMEKHNKSVLEGVPRGLPAMVKAYRIQEKVSSVGFDFKNSKQVFDKIKEELCELEDELKSDSKEKIEREFGDVLFSLINYARFLNIDPETALELTNRKFIKRFQYVERNILKPFDKSSLEDMDKLWEESKKEDKI